MVISHYPPQKTISMKSLHIVSSSKISTNPSFSPQWLLMYNNFITKNQSAVTSIESTLRSLTYIIPGRFRDAEIASESLHCSVQLLSLYHDTLLLHSNNKSPIGHNSNSIHNRYTKFWCKRSRLYPQVALLLYIIQYTKLLWEMLAKRRSDRARWRVVIILEAIEAFCKFSLLRITKSRPPVHPPLPIRDIESAEIISTEDEFVNTKENEQTAHPKEYYLKRTGLSIPSLPNPKNISKYLLSRVVTAEDIKMPFTLLNQLGGSAYLAELLHILQPLIYSIAMSKNRNKKNWQPWLLGFGIEYAACRLRNDSSRTTVLETEQWGKRSRAMAWWIMRGAFYENISKGIINRTSKRLPSFISSVVDDYLYLWDEYHFSTSSY